MPSWDKTLNTAAAAAATVATWWCWRKVRDSRPENTTRVMSFSRYYENWCGVPYARYASSQKEVRHERRRWPAYTHVVQQRTSYILLVQAANRLTRTGNGTDRSVVCGVQVPGIIYHNDTFHPRSLGLGRHCTDNARNTINLQSSAVNIDRSGGRRHWLALGTASALCLV